MNQKEIFSHHRLLTALGRKHPNQYVALAGRRVLAYGRKQSDVLKKVSKMQLAKQEVLGLYYLPGRKRHLYLLKCRHY